MPGARRRDRLEVVLTEEQLELLRSLDLVRGEELLGAVRVPGGLAVRMGRAALEDLVGEVAAEANHARRGRRQEMLHEIADEMEAELSRR